MNEIVEIYSRHCPNVWWETEKIYSYYTHIDYYTGWMDVVRARTKMNNEKNGRNIDRILYFEIENLINKPKGFSYRNSVRYHIIIIVIMIIISMVIMLERIFFSYKYRYSDGEYWPVWTIPRCAVSQKTAAAHPRETGRRRRRRWRQRHIDRRASGRARDSRRRRRAMTTIGGGSGHGRVGSVAAAAAAKSNVTRARSAGHGARGLAAWGVAGRAEGTNDEIAGRLSHDPPSSPSADTVTDRPHPTSRVAVYRRKSSLYYSLPPRPPPNSPFESAAGATCRRVRVCARWPPPPPPPSRVCVYIYIIQHRRGPAYARSSSRLHTLNRSSVLSARAHFNTLRIIQDCPILWWCLFWKCSPNQRTRYTWSNTSV